MTQSARPSQQLRTVAAVPVDIGRGTEIVGEVEGDLHDAQAQPANAAPTLDRGLVPYFQPVECVESPVIRGWQQPRFGDTSTFGMGAPFGLTGVHESRCLIFRRTLDGDSYALAMQQGLDGLRDGFRAAVIIRAEQDR